MTYADRIPAPRPIPGMSARFADARRCGHTPEEHRHLDGQDADAASHDRAIRELTAELDRTRAELGATQELLAVVDDVTEQLDRARARYATRPEVTPVEADQRPLQHVSVLANCIACGARCPNGKCPNDTPAAPSSVPPRRAQEPRPGQFCTEHFSWLCQAGQGRCQGKREG